MADRNIGTSTITATTTTTTQTGVQTRTGTETSLVPNTVSYNLGDRIVDVSQAAFIRQNDVAFSAVRMKPNTRVYAFFDGVDVNAYVTPNGGTLGGALITDNYGYVAGTFTVPNNDTLRFQTGVRMFRLTDSSTNSFTTVRTSAETPYQAEGLLLNAEKTILSTRVAKIEQSTVTQSAAVVKTTSTTTVTSAPAVTRTNSLGDRRSDNDKRGDRDPLAQTFKVPDVEGAFLTKIDLYFKTKSDSSPITVQLRAVNNGYPAPAIIPFSNVTLNPTQVLLSEDATVATTFTFDAPVYLQGDTEYAIVVIADSVDYEIWCSTLGQNIVGTDTRISEQPSLGSLFLSQNNTAWTPLQESDLKFKLYRAVFTTGVTGTAQLVNKDLAAVRLGLDAFSSTNASNTVTVYMPNHGLQNGSGVTFAGAASFNGITASSINGVRTVSGVTLDTFTFTYTVNSNNPNANATGRGGGGNATAIANFNMDVMCPAIGTIQLPQTTLGFAAKTTSKGYTLDSSYTDIVANDNNFMSTSKIIASAANQTSLMAGTKSLNIQASMSSDNDLLSPVIDLTRSSVIAVGNRINSLNTNETLANGAGASVAKYLTKKIVLDEAATELKVLFSANVPPEADVYVYYKILEEYDTTTVFSDADFILLPASNTPAKDSISTAFRDYEFDANSLTPFTSFVVKIVMTSTDTAKIPRIRDFRALALS